MHYSYYRSREFSTRIITVGVFFLLAISGIIFSLYLFYVSHTIYLYIVSTLFLLLSVFVGGFNIYASLFYFDRSYSYKEFFNKIKEKPYESENKNLPTVAIAIPVFNEDTKLVNMDMMSLTKINYPKDKIKFYLLDDSTDKNKRKKFEEFASKYNFSYIHRDDRFNFKAGALNNFMKYSKEEFLAIFDYDEELINKNYLLDLLPYFKDENLSYVQTKKDYFKTGRLFDDSCTIFDSLFFDLIEPARAIDNTAIFAGSCGIIRRKSLDEVGGFPASVVEDTFFSFNININNMKGYYIPKVYALGRSMTTFTNLAKQQWRYNYGGTQFLGYFLKNRKRVKSARENVEYFTHGFGLNYMSVMVLLFTVISALIVFSNLPFTHFNFYKILLDGTNSIYAYLEAFGMISLIMSFLAPVIITKVYFGSIKRGILFYLLNFGLVIIRTKAAIAAVFNLSPKMNWTKNKNTKQNRLVYSIVNTKVELGFVSFLLLLSYISGVTKHFGGCLWLLGYGLLYLVTTILMYKYK